MITGDFAKVGVFECLDVAKPEKREPIPDVRYNSVQVQTFINRVMRRGKKSVATTVVYDAFDMVEERTKRSGLEVFEQAMKNVAPVMEVKPSPCWWRYLPGPDGSPRLPPLCPGHPLDSCRLPRPALGRSSAEKLAGELLDAANNTGLSHPQA